MAIPYPPNEAERLRALHESGILDTSPEQGFDDLTVLAAHLCNAPIALISLIDEDRQWFKSRVGLSAQETARDISFCTHAICGPELFVVRDACEDPRFVDNPLVTEDPRIRFYAGAPLVTTEGYALGTLCVIDHVARDLRSDQEQALRVLSHHVITQLELRRALAGKRQAEEALTEREQVVHALRRQLSEHTSLGSLIGKTKPMTLVYQQIQDIACVDSTVLIEGETGTGKELVARAIHALSHRSAKPFITVNCAGLTESLVASQLFGHRRGAFTGAVEHHQGLFEAAEGGTLFLDEIGDIPPSMQTTLLRVLQEKEVTRVGESKPRQVNVRVLAATHHDLAQDVEVGRFRADLLYRIRVARIHLPPLRERREDIPLLAAEFLAQPGTASDKDVRSIGPDAMQLLIRHHWPGNVRELRSAIEYGMIHCRGGVLQRSDLPPEIVGDDQAAPPQGRPQDKRERILFALQRAGGNRKVAAQLLGVSRATFYRHLHELGISPDA